MTRTSLVLVEDHKDSLDAFAIALGQKFAVFAYTSPVAALQAIDAVDPAILVLDIGMQPMDGMQCLERIRDMPRYRHIPAVALTGYAREDDRRRFLDHGFQAVVAKPVDLDEFVALIDSVAKSTAADPRRTRVLSPLSALVDAGPEIAPSRKGEPGETDPDGRP